jgi:hypothetical protein
MNASWSRDYIRTADVANIDVVAKIVDCAWPTLRGIVWVGPIRCRTSSEIASDATDVGLKPEQIDSAGLLSILWSCVFHE